MRERSESRVESRYGGPSGSWSGSTGGTYGSVERRVVVVVVNVRRQVPVPGCVCRT